MPAPRPQVRKTQGLHNLGKGGNNHARYVTDCKLCRAGVYQHQPHRWLTKPMGLSHNRCAERAGLIEGASR